MMVLCVAVRVGCDVVWCVVVENVCVARCGLWLQWVWSVVCRVRGAVWYVVAVGVVCCV